MMAVLVLWFLPLALGLLLAVLTRLERWAQR